MNSSNDKWFGDMILVVEFGAALEECGLNARQLQDYYQRPLRYEDERETWLLGGHVALEFHLTEGVPPIVALG